MGRAHLFGKLDQLGDDCAVSSERSDTGESRFQHLGEQRACTRFLRDCVLISSLISLRNSSSANSCAQA